MSISITDSLALVAIQAGQVGTPSTEAAAAGNSKLDSQQRSVEIGEPVPIVFGRRRSIGGITAGGVLISPGATECRFENDATNNVTAYYHLVLSEGEIDSIPVKDVFQRSCRVGSHSQTYNRRAGTWTPANAIVEREGYDKPEATYYCGSKGAYPGMSTLSFSVTIPNGFDQWNRQVHCFIRGGMHLTRLYDNTEGPSDNFADLVQWMLTNSGRVPTSLIDTTALDGAATFLEVNGFTCNCWITESINYADLLTKWAPYFLLCESNASGKRGLRPVVPTTEAGAIDTGAITPVWTFTEDHITVGSLQIQYSNLAERRPFVAQMIWRQQLEDDFGILRTAEVRYSGTAETGPYESHDLSEFCTTENHAVKVGAYILSKRTRTSHTIRFSAKPQANNTTVTAGDIIRVRLARQATTAGTGYHDFLYQVERITKTLAGELSYECTHFPVDADGKSLIALDVAAAAGTGILLTSNKSGVGCDLNSSSDNTIPAETWSNADDLGYQETLINGDYEAAPDGDVDNTSDFIDAVSLGALTPGSTLGSYQTPAGVYEGGRIILSYATIDGAGNIVPGTLQQVERPDWSLPTSLIGQNNLYARFQVVYPSGQDQTSTAISPVSWTLQPDQWYPLQSATAITRKAEAVFTITYTPCGAPSASTYSFTGQAPLPQVTATAYRYRITQVVYDSGRCSPAPAQYVGATVYATVEYKNSQGNVVKWADVILSATSPFAGVGTTSYVFDLVP